MKDLEKEFKPTSWSIDNKVAIYVATVIICLAGIMTYNSLPKENFPEVVFPQIYVATIFPGASPQDVENLVTKQIEKQVKSIAGIKKITSNSVQDFSNVIIEFETDIEVKEAKREVQEAVDKAKANEPDLILMDISMPVMDGLTATQIIRKFDGFSKVPIIAVTAYGKSYYRQAIEAGCDDLINKPLDFDNLQPILEQYLA